MKLLYQNEIDDKIRELCDDEFLSKLCEVARLYGWLGDYIEIAYFVQGLHSEVGKDCPNIEPYETRE